MSNNKTEIKDEKETVDEKAKESDVRPVCGLIMPIADTEGYPAGHWKEVRKLLTSVAEGAGFRTRLVSESDEVRVIQANIVQNIFEDDVIICDVSSKNPNVMFELGLRLAFDKAAVIVKDFATGYSFDTSPVQHINYPKDLRYYDIEKFREELKMKLLATFEESKKPNHSMYLESFGKFVPKGLKNKEVSNDQYMIQTLQEIKNEISIIKVQNRNNYDSYSSNIITTIDGKTKYNLDYHYERYIKALPPGQPVDDYEFYNYLNIKTLGTSHTVPPFLTVVQYLSSRDITE
ncbi:hypothetical protein ACFQO9_11190 [Chryseobacterium zhengzhouense]|uniref:RNA helicase n=1 Tax=Chryseobacterium zhengzhouense TaxID=1636086 RepID=A0ABW2M1L9_9FLAO